MPKVCSCGSERLIEEEGSLICTVCGTLLENVIFAENTFEGSRASEFAQRSVSNLEGGKIRFVSSEKRGLTRIKSALQKACSILSLTSHYEATLEAFQRFSQAPSSRKYHYGQRGLLDVYATLFVLCFRERGRGITIGEFASKLAVDKYRLGASIKQVQAFLERENESPISPLRDFEVQPQVNEVCAFVGLHDQQIKDCILQLYEICMRESLVKGAVSVKVLVSALAWLNMQSTSSGGVDGQPDVAHSNNSAMANDASMLQKKKFADLCAHLSISLQATQTLVRELRRSFAMMVKHLPWSADITPRNVHFYLQDVCTFGKIDHSHGSQSKDRAEQPQSLSTQPEEYDEQEFDEFITENILIEDSQELAIKKSLLFG